MSIEDIINVLRSIELALSRTEREAIEAAIEILEDAERKISNELH